MIKTFDLVLILSNFNYMVCYCADYMAPETLQCAANWQLAKGNHGVITCGTSVDIWAVGVMAFQSLVSMVALLIQVCHVC